ncbi:MAG: hypothetical protein JWQ42_3209 [Edaphobacter sp.]|nr:hypothetical protein [Edaphobacter sp.]
MANFLLYVVDRHISNRGDEITEQQIGVLVFGRSEGYDSNEDNIVRSYARNLRKRIDEYFAKEGVEESLLLEIPRGGYTPIFSVRTPRNNPVPNQLIGDAESNGPSELADAVFASSKTTENLALEDRDRSAHHSVEALDSRAIAGCALKMSAAVRRHSTIPALCIGLILGVGCSIFLPLKPLKRVAASSAEVASTALWTQIFSSKRDTFIVPSDDGLVIMQGLTERPVPLASYVSGSYRTNAKTDGVPGALEILKLGGRRYTSVVDLDFTAHLAQLDEVVPERMMIRYARDLRMDDLRNGNAILIGSVEANPWIELFQPQLNFRFSIHPGSDKPSGILNSHPRIGEDVIYGTPGQDHTYGLIAYVPNLNSTGHVLIVGGLNTAGTQAATTFLLTPSLMQPTLQRAKTAHGGLQSFELLIGAGNVASNASTPQMILERIGPF